MSSAAKGGRSVRARCAGVVLGLALAVFASAASADAASRDSALRASASTDPQGTLTIVGSDTLSGLVQRWTTMFHAHHRGVRIQLQTPGSASAPLALIEGATDLGAMSRPMSEDEQRAFRARYGHDATGVVVAHDAIVVIVHPDNPLRAITRRQLDAVYSSTRRCGGAAPVESWAALGVVFPGPNQSVLPVGRNEASGTSEFFREEALCAGHYRPDVVAWPGHGATVAAVAANPEAIGYVGIGSLNGLVKPLAYAPRERRALLTALFGLDDALASILRTTREPMVGQMRLTWWREALERLDREPAPAEPVLQALAAMVLRRGVAGGDLAGVVDGWEALLVDPLDDAAMIAHAERGRVLFTSIARAIGARDAASGMAGKTPTNLPSGATFATDPVYNCVTQHAPSGSRAMPPSVSPFWLTAIVPSVVPSRPSRTSSARVGRLTQTLPWAASTATPPMAAPRGH